MNRYYEKYIKNIFNHEIPRRTTGDFLNIAEFR